MGSILRDIRQALSGLVIPREFSLMYSGDIEAQEEAFQEVGRESTLDFEPVLMVTSTITD